MKKQLLYSGAIVLGSAMIAAAVLFARHPTQIDTNKTQRSNNNQQIEELNARIARVEQKAAALRTELDQVRRQPQSVIFTPATNFAPRVVTQPESRGVPPSWKPFEFNGRTYYFTPLGEKAELSMAPAK